jgi:hypothetical protein
VPGVPWLGECCGGDFGDVRRIDQGCRCVGERRAYDIACVELVTPAQHVGLKRARAKNGPGKSLRLHRFLRLEVVSPHRVAGRTELRGA